VVDFGIARNQDVAERDDAAVIGDTGGDGFIHLCQPRQRFTDDLALSLDRGSHHGRLQIGVEGAVRDEL
jgi:hypothetical protein